MKATIKHIILLFYFFTLPFLINAQNHWADSVKNAAETENAYTNRINALISLSSAYRFTYPDSGLVWARQALALSEKTGNDTLIFWSYVSISSCLYPLGNFSAELDYALKVQPVAKRLNTVFARGYSNGMLSDAYLNFGEYQISLDYWRKVLAIVEHEARDELTAIYGNSAFIFACARQYDSSLIYGRKAFKELNQNDQLKKDSSAIYFFQW